MVEKEAEEEEKEEEGEEEKKKKRISDLKSRHQETARCQRKETSSASRT